MNMTPNDHQFNHIVAFEVSKHELIVHTLPVERQQTVANAALAELSDSTEPSGQARG